MVNIQEEISSRKVGNALYFDYRRFFGMLSVWLVCAVFSFFPLILRPMFTKVAETMDVGYWIMVFSDNDVLYLIVAISVVAVGMSILIGKRNSVAVYLIAVLEVIGIFLAMMGYLMLEGDPVLFGDAVYKINIWAVVISVVLAFVLFLSVSFRVREGAEK